MGRYSYLALNIIFYTPLYIVTLWLFKKRLKNLNRTFVNGFFVGVVYFLVVDPFAVVWKAWEFNYSKTFHPFLGPTLWEEMLWSALAFGYASIFVHIFAGFEEKKQDIKDIFKKR